MAVPAQSGVMQQTLPARTQRGFTLIELVAVMIVVAVLAISAQGLGRKSEVQVLQASRDQVLLALRSAQHLAMAKAGAARSIEFVSSANRIDVRDSGSSLLLGNTQYPLELGHGVQLNATSIRFDKLGRASPVVLTMRLGQASATITVAATGVAN